MSHLVPITPHVPKNRARSRTALAARLWRGVLRALVLVTGIASTATAQASPQPATPPSEPRLRVAVAGVVHGHVHGIMRAAQQRRDVEVVAVYEPDETLRNAFGDRYRIAPDARFARLDALITAAHPEALLVNTNTFDHLAVVETAARHGVHVVVEKPLAVSVEHARAMAAAAQRGRIHVLVNYETTWYRSHRAIWRLMQEEKTGGQIRKIVAMDGHHGPKEIGVQPEFFDWLTDPVRNGAGALYDFG